MTDFEQARIEMSIRLIAMKIELRDMTTHDFLREDLDDDIVAEITKFADSMQRTSVEDVVNDA